MTGPVDHPPAEVAIDAELVRSLLVAQHPDLAALPLRELASGWDNVIFRLGDELVVRLPRRALAAPLIEHEQRWLPALAERLPLPIPAPVRVGLPDSRFSWHWSISTWFDGTSALTGALADPEASGRQVGQFLAALHQPAPVDAPSNPFRGMPLAERDDLTQEWIGLLVDHIDGPATRSCWEDHAALPVWDGPPLWLHGDLHPGNVIIDRGRVTAIIDFGDITSGDPATDLAVAWMLLPPHARPSLRDAAGVDDATWGRGRGWALALGLAYLAHSASTPDFAEIGRATIAAVLEDWRRGPDHTT